VKCPKCNNRLSAAEINILENIGHCKSCNHVFDLKEQLEEAKELEKMKNFDPEVTPDKVSHERYQDKILIKFSLRSKMALFLIPFTMVWSGVSIGGIYMSQIAARKFDLVSSLFGLPFLLGTVFLLFLIVKSIAGKIEITLNNQGGESFSGFGPFGIKKKWRWDEIVQVAEGSSNVRINGVPLRPVRLEGQRLVKLGSTLPKEQTDYLRDVMTHYYEQIKRRSYII
jgi:hypothetical protein